MNDCAPTAGTENRGLLDRDGWNLTILIAVALVLGAYLTATSTWISRDGVFYIDQAKAIAHDPLQVVRTYPAGYPFLLFAAHRVGALFGADESAAAWVASSLAVTGLLRLLALIPLYFLARMLVGPRKSFWALLILVILPYPAHNGSDVLREWPFVLFLALGVWLLFVAVRSRRWWLFGVIGLDVGLGYLIRPECAQVIVYGLIALVVVSLAEPQVRAAALVKAGALLLAGFAIPAAPYVALAGLPTTAKLPVPTVNEAPVIASVGGRTARGAAIRFEVNAGSLLEMPIEAFDPEGHSVGLSIVGVPVGSQPVYRLRLVRNGDRLWTISNRQKDSLLTDDRPGVWDYEGIGCYAYAEPNAAVGLLPVYGFWSAAQGRHFYTLSESQRETLAESDPESRWQSEGVAFYAFGEDHPPADAIAVYRFRNPDGESIWAVEGLVRDEFAWYAHAGFAPPAGLSLDGNVVRWRPGPEQQGSHQVNVIVDDGRLQDCQLIRIEVVDAEPAHAGVARLGDAGGSLALLRVANLIFRSISDNLMQYFLLPLCVGLWYRLRYEAGPYERALMIAIVTVSVALMVGRYLWIQPVVARRYSLGLIALTIAYVPVGLDVIAQWLARLVKSHSRQAPSERTLQRRWFCLLVVVGATICLPKLVAREDDKNSAYLAAVRWLRDHTAADAAIAVPDCRIGFYAEREYVLYEWHVNPRRVDYIVTVSQADAPGAVPPDWAETFSLQIESNGGKSLAIHKHP